LCPSGWFFSFYSGTCLKIYSESKGWDDARNICRKTAGSDLVKIVSYSMNKFIAGALSDMTWIGLQQGSFGSHEFHWLDEKEEVGATKLN
ncbi:B-cell differentiation antigen CD72, partial [Elysia marginata]